MSVLEFWRAHAGELAVLLRQHLVLVGLSTAAAIVIGVPAGVYAARNPRTGAPLAAMVSAAFPSRSVARVMPVAAV